MSPEKLTLHWLTPKEVQARWNIDRQTLERFVKEQSVEGNGLQAYYYRKPDHSLSDTDLQRSAKCLLFRISKVDEALIDEKAVSFLKGCLFRLKDVRRFERESRELLHMSDKDLFILRTADYVRAWVRFNTDWKNDCIKQRLYSRTSARTEEGLQEYFPGHDSDSLRKALQATGALPKRKGGRTKTSFNCPWKRCILYLPCHTKKPRASAKR